MKIKEKQVASVFRRLRQMGVIAKRNFSCCGSCASYDLGRELDAAHAAGECAPGIAYYHEQDRQSMVRNGKMWIGYGGQDRAASLRIGHMVKAAAEAEGLKVEWNGSSFTRICIEVAA